MVNCCWVVLGLYSCQKDDAAKTPFPVNPLGTPTANVNKTSMLQLVNNLRQTGCTCGSTVMPPVSPIAWNDQLATAAFNHSAEMNAKNYFNHTGLNGSTGGDRITAAGYIWRTYGENIAEEYTSEQSVMVGWILSEGHCKNIMNPILGRWELPGLVITGLRNLGLDNSGCQLAARHLTYYLILGLPGTKLPMGAVYQGRTS